MKVFGLRTPAGLIGTRIWSFAPKFTVWSRNKGRNVHEGSHGPGLQGPLDSSCLTSDPNSRLDV